MVLQVKLELDARLINGSCIIIIVINITLNLVFL